MRKPQPRIKKFIKDFRTLVAKHVIILDKYAHDGEDVYCVFKAQHDDSSIRLEDLISPVYHGKVKGIK